MVSDKYKCIFIQVPRTGSTSISHILGPTPKWVKPHLNIWQIKCEMEKSRERFLDYLHYYKFGFVRNPWDRFVSLYERGGGLQMRNKMTFDMFIDWVKYSSCTCLHPVPHRYQLDWFVDPHGNVLVHFIGKFENLQDDWRIVASRLGIDEELPHINKIPRKKHYTEYYTDRTRDIVAERFRVDIEYFGYEFGK